MNEYEESLEDILIRILQEGKTELSEEIKNILNLGICSKCAGSGITIVSHTCCVTHEMALDACEPDMEGQEWVQEDEVQCEFCNGTGKTSRMKSIANHWRDVAWKYYREAGAPGVFGEPEVTLDPKCDKCNEDLTRGSTHHCSAEYCCD